MGLLRTRRARRDATKDRRATPRPTPPRAPSPLVDQRRERRVAAPARPARFAFATGRDEPERRAIDALLPRPRDGFAEAAPLVRDRVLDDADFFALDLRARVVRFGAAFAALAPFALRRGALDDVLFVPLDFTFGEERFVERVFFATALFFVVERFPLDRPCGIAHLRAFRRAHRLNENRLAKPTEHLC